MAQDIENPFGYWGKIVGAPYFWGREKALQAIDSRVFRSGRSLAIVGLPRIGKSSLAYYAIIDQEEEFLKRKKVPIWINLGNHGSAYDFFFSLVYEPFVKLEELNWINASLRTAFNEVERRFEQIQTQPSWYMYLRSIENFFREVKASDIHLILVLDEFDRAKDLFRAKDHFFNALRSLGYESHFSIAFVTTSRRSIQEIIHQAQAGSPLGNIFQNIYLGMFNEQDLHAYFAQLEVVNLSVDQKVKEQIHFYAGKHPYLLAMLGCQLIELARIHELEDVKILLAHQEEFFKENYIDFYRRMELHLAENELLKKLLQVLFGPVLDIKPIDVDELVRYDLIHLNKQNVYETFSEHFELFLKWLEQSIQLWPIWSEAEKQLRTTVAQVFQQKYGENWFATLERSYGTFNIRGGKNFFERCRESQQRAQQIWRETTPQNLLSFANPGDILQLVMKEWEKALFKDIFGKDKSYWAQRAELLARIRNALAHNWDEVIAEYDRNLAEKYCREIIETLQKQT